MKRNITIIGASISGLTTAWSLARAGVPVQIFEAQAPFQPAERTLIVTPAFLKLIGNTTDLILNRITTFELISPRNSVRISLREPDLVLDRARLLSLLVQRVESAGGKIFFGHRLTSIHANRNHQILQFITGKDKEWSTSAFKLLGADGVNSTVSTMFNKADSLEQVGLAQARVLLPPDLSPNIVRVWFDRTTTRFFYWLIPESPKNGVLGVIAESLSEAQQLLDRFISAQGFVTIDYQVGANVPLYPLNWNTASTGNGQVLLVGDAAGQVKVTTVGGVVTGMRGGLAAARSILNNTPYDVELRSLRSELLSHAIVRYVLDYFTDEDYDQLLKMLNRQTLKVLSRYHRDNLLKILWLILLSQPNWLLLTMRVLMKVSNNKH